MGRPRKPYFRQSDGWWGSRFNGVYHKLAKGRENKAEAECRFHELHLLERVQRPADSPVHPVASDIEQYLRLNAGRYSGRGLEERRRYLQLFAGAHGWRQVNDRDCLPIHLESWIAQPPTARSPPTGRRAAAAPASPAPAPLGGGLSFEGTLTATLVNVAVTLNSGAAGTVTMPPSGTAVGGVEAKFGATVQLLNTIAAQDVSARPDVGGTFTSLGHDLIGDPTGSTGFVNDVTGDLVGGNGNPVLNLELAPLADNAGPTPTNALLPDSPPVGHGDAVRAAPYNLSTDQRGLPRKSGPTVDIGACELQQPLPPSQPPSPPTPPPPSVSVAFSPLGEVIEVVYPNGILVQHDAFGGVASASVAFGPQGKVLEVVNQADELRQFSAAGGQLLGGGVQSAGVAFSPGGTEILDLIFQDGPFF